MANRHRGRGGDGFRAAARRVRGFAALPRRLGLRRARISTRLVVALSVCVSVVALVTGWLNGREQERQLVGAVVEGGNQLSRSIVSATWHAMRADRREDAYAVIETIGRRHNVERVRLFDNVGRVAFASPPSADDGPATKDSAPCTICHDRDAPLVRVDEPRLARQFVGADGHRKLGVVTAIYNEAECSAAPCHAHPADQAVLGVLDVTLDLGDVEAGVDALRRRTFVLIGVEVLLLGSVIAVSVRHLVGRPVRRLVGATRRIADMDLDQPLERGDDTELGELAAAFERMRLRLRDALRELEGARLRLSEKVDERTRQLEAAESRLIRSDRLASLGQLAGVVAHEINNPLGAVLTLSTLMERILSDRGIPPGREQEFRRYLADVSRETARAGRIVADLLAFSRRGTPQRVPTDLGAVAARTLSLLRHKLELQRVALRTEFAPGLPPVLCDPGQMEQVVLNLVMNAAEASEPGGEVLVRTSAAPDGAALVLEVRDRGAGIAPEHLPRVFEPFFTTKEAGKGVGLGLAVVYGIVAAHQGDVEVESVPGRGTSFRVTLPLGGALQASAAARTEEAA